MAANLNDDFLKQYSRLSSMKPEQLAAFQKRLEAVVELFGKGTKEAQTYEKMLGGVNSRMDEISASMGTFTKLSEMLITKLGSMDKGAGSVTKFTDNVLKSTFSVDKASGTMKMLGMQTQMTTAQFAKMLNTASLVATVGTAVLNTMVKVQQKEMEYVKLAGGTAEGKITTGTQYDIKAEGLRIGGKAGAEAADTIAKALMAERKDVFATLASGDRRRLTSMQVGEATDLAPIMRKLIKDFGIGAGAQGKQARDLTDLMQRMGVAAHLAKVPLEDYSQAVLGIADQFITSGVKVGDVESYMQSVADDWGTGKMQQKVLVNFQQTMLQQATTAEGLQPEATAGVFLKKTYSKLSADTQKTLDIQAEKSSGGRVKKYSQLNNALELADVVEKLTTSGQYAQVFADFKPKFNELFAKGSPGMTDQLMKQITPAAIGIQEKQAQAFVAGVTPGKGVTERALAPENIDRTLIAYESFTNSVGQGTKELTAAFSGFVTDIKKILATNLVPEVTATGDRNVTNVAAKLTERETRNAAAREVTTGGPNANLPFVPASASIRTNGQPLTITVTQDTSVSGTSVSGVQNDR